MDESSRLWIFYCDTCHATPCPKSDITGLVPGLHWNLRQPEKQPMSIQLQRKSGMGQVPGETKRIALPERTRLE